MNSIITQDLGSKTGFVLGSLDGSVTLNTGTWDLKKRRDDSLGLRTDRLRCHLDQLFELAKKGGMNVTHISYEKVMRHSGTRAAHSYGAFLGLVEAVALHHRVELLPVHVTTLKKFATGKYRASKAMMIQAALEEGWEVVDDNHADAIWLYLSAVTNMAARNLT